MFIEIYIKIINMSDGEDYNFGANLTDGDSGTMGGFFGGGIFRELNTPGRQLHGVIEGVFIVLLVVYLVWAVSLNPKDKSVPSYVMGALVLAGIIYGVLEFLDSSAGAEYKDKLKNLLPPQVGSTL